MRHSDLREMIGLMIRQISQNVEELTYWALPCEPRFRLRRNHAFTVFPPFGFNR